MSDLNLAIIRGRLTRNAEYKIVNGVKVCNFSIACNYSRKNANTGEWSTVADYFDCAIFNNYAESMYQHLTKGRPVIVQARLKQDRWETAGEKKSRISLICSSIEFLPQGNKNTAAEPDSNPDFNTEETETDEIPF